MRTATRQGWEALVSLQRLPGPAAPSEETQLIYGTTDQFSLASAQRNTGLTRRIAAAAAAAAAFCNRPLCEVAAACERFEALTDTTDCLGVLVPR